MEFDVATLPADWQVKAIREVTVSTSYRDPGKQPDKTFHYVDVSSVDNTLFKVTNTSELKGLEAPSRARKDIRTNDVIFATVRPTLRRIALIPPELDGAIASTGYCVLRSEKEKVVPRFLYAWLLTDWFVKTIGTLERGANYPAVRDSDVFTANIPLPSLDEQRKIAAVLGMVQQAIEQQERLIALATELKKTLLHQLFTQGLRGEPQKETEIGLVPQSWTPTPLGECCDILGGSLSYTDFLKMASSDEDGAVECMGVKVSDMNLPGNESRFIIANLSKRLPMAMAERKLIPPNTVVFPKRGAAIATNKKRLTTTWTVLDPNLIGVRAKDVVYPEFLFHWSQTFDLRKITDPGTTPQLNKKDLVPVLLPLPKEIEEQREIAHAISCVDNKLRFHQQKLSSFTDLFRTLLHQLMTAQIRVNDIQFDDIVSKVEAA